MGARKGPNATTRAFVRLKCRSELAKPTPRCAPGSPGPARARFCVRFWAPEGAPRGPKSEQKADQKCLHKHLRFRSRFGAKFYRFGGPKSVIFGTRKRNQVHIQIARCIRKMYWKNQLKINILELELGEILKKKGSKNGTGEGTKIQCNFSSIFVHFGCPFGVSFGPKMVQKRGPKTSAKMKVSSSVLGRVTTLRVDCDQTPSRLRVDCDQTPRRLQGYSKETIARSWAPINSKLKPLRWPKVSCVLCQMQSANSKCKV